MTRRSFHRRRRVLGTSLIRLLMSRAPRTVSRAFSGRSALLTIGKQLRINMNSYSSGRRHPGRAVGAGGEEIKKAFGDHRNRRRRKKRTFGSALPKFSETAARKRK